MKITETEITSVWAKQLRKRVLTYFKLECFYVSLLAKSSSDKNNN